ncbi:hypothetical protein BD779DRAFT_1681076 [Infundibulicybe gibba]|nr:hypothetical protein BD779DRAFT_1681076 [Infundibulicybe gibba]
MPLFWFLPQSQGPSHSPIRAHYVLWSRLGALGPPVERLPAEIVLRIIQLASQDPDCGLPGERAILASHVCSHWRKFVVRCPFLWANIRISNIPPKTLKLARASAFLARSGQFPLDITIEAEPGFLGGKWVSVTGAIAELIAPHVHRVRRFHLTYTESSRVEDVMGMIPRSPARMLEVLSIRRTPPLRGSWASTLVLPCLQSFTHGKPISSEESAALFPGLRDLSFLGASLKWSTFAPRNLRSLVLKDLGISTPTWSELRAVLQATAPTLTTLVINNSCPLISSHSLSCALPALKSLSLGDSSPSTLERLVALVDVPSLIELSLIDTWEHGMTAIGSSQTATIASMLQYIPLHQIHTLHLSHLVFLPSSPPAGPVVTEADCDAAPHSLFVRLHQLRRLTLVHPDAHTVRALSHTLASPTLRPAHPMPLLSHLSLECISDEEFTNIMHALNRRAMPDSVVPATRPLEEFMVCVPRHREGQVVPTRDYECPKAEPPPQSRAINS